MSAFYNEIDPAAAHVLRTLIADGVIAPGVVDTRPIQELQPHDLAGFTQVHLFAGGGLWSVAARLARWPDDRPLWTGSCPCQPFSAAGKRRGRSDERHLWPDMARLVRACRPPVVVGEQVAGSAGLDWVDGVADDLAGADYACRTVDIPAAAVDAPHIRQRLYWVAVDNAERAGLEGLARHGDGETGRSLAHRPVAAADGGDVDDADREGRLQPQGAVSLERGWRGDADARRNGSFWSGADWIACHDGKARRAKPGIRLLVDGVPGRVGLWRIAGNAIVPQLAAAVLAALRETLDAGRAA